MSIGHTTSETTVNDNLTVTGYAEVICDFIISSATNGINTTSGSNVAHDEEGGGTTLTANNYRRGKYTFTTHTQISSATSSGVFTVANNTTTADDIVIMNCTSNHKIEVHPYNVSTSGWDFFIINQTGGPINADTDLVFNFIVMQ